MNLSNNLPEFQHTPPPPTPKTTPDQLAAIEEMAAHGFSFQEILEVIGSEGRRSDSLHFGLTLDEYISYRKGILKSQLELRQRIFIDAKNGSSPAQALAKKILDDAEFKMNDR